jgi:hypothetical protein
MTIVSLSACKRESSTQNGTVAAYPVGGACYPYSNGYKGSPTREQRPAAINLNHC